MGFIKNTNYKVGVAQLAGKGVAPPNADVKFSFDYAYLYKTYGASSSEYRHISDVAIDYIEVDGKAQKQCVILYFLPSIFDGYIEACEIWRRKKQKVKVNDVWPDQWEIDANWSKVDDIDHQDEGVFIDYGEVNPSTKSYGDLPDAQIAVYNYESGLFWSEPYRPDYIKSSSFIELASGDGSQITGISSLYGSLIVFKDNSIHRCSTQGINPPVSRVDEITPEYGCIAPSTLLNVDNTLYFLSWKGFCAFNNNTVQKIDVKFSEELNYLLTSVDETRIRLSTAGYNATYNEIWLTIPWLPSSSSYNEQADDSYYAAGDTPNRRSLGNTFVISLDKGYVTKFGFPSNVEFMDDFVLNPSEEITPYSTSFNLKYCRDSLDTVRKYYTNSLGEMRSADIRPFNYIKRMTQALDSKRLYLTTAGFYLETPRNNSQEANDEIICLTHEYLFNSQMAPYVPWFENVTPFDINNLTNANSKEAKILGRTAAIVNGDYYTDPIKIDKFPLTVKIPVKSIYKSKYFSGDTETMIKRVRKVSLNIYSQDRMNIKAIALPYENPDDRYLDYPADPNLISDYYFNMTQSHVSPTFGQVMYGELGSNIISFAPFGRELIDGFDTRYAGKNDIHNPTAEPKNPFAVEMVNEADVTAGTAVASVETSVDQEYTKPIRFSIEIISYGRMVLGQLNLFWRGVAKYLS